MTQHPTEILLSEIDTFLSDTGMGEAYFGKAAAGNSELVSRLRKRKLNGCPRNVWPETAERVRKFIATRTRSDAAA